MHREPRIRRSEERHTQRKKKGTEDGERNGRASEPSFFSSAVSNFEFRPHSLVPRASPPTPHTTPSLSIMALLCSNCEFAEADLSCLQCRETGEDNLFCRSCAAVHGKVKRYRGHTFERAARASARCSNCDVEVATHRCADCKVGEQHLCRQCAVFHSKVKCFKDHRVIELSGGARRPGDDNAALGRVGDMLDGLSAAFARSHLSTMLDFSGVQVPQAQVYVPLLLCTAVSFLLLRPVLGKHGSSIVTIIGSLMVLRVMQSPAPRHDRHGKGETFTISAGRRDPAQPAAPAAATAPALSLPAVRLTGSSKVSKQQRNPPLVLKSPLGTGSGTGSDLNSWLPTAGRPAAPATAPPLAATKRPSPPLQFGAAAGWEDDEDEEFRDEFTYHRNSTAATLRSRGPAYRGRRSRKMASQSDE